MGPAECRVLEGVGATSLLKPLSFLFFAADALLLLSNPALFCLSVAAFFAATESSNDRANGYRQFSSRWRLPSDHVRRCRSPYQSPSVLSDGRPVALWSPSQ